VVPRLNIGEKKDQVAVTPSHDASVGRYEIRVQTTSLSDNQPVQGEDKTITVEIQSEAEYLWHNADHSAHYRIGCRDGGLWHKTVTKIKNHEEHMNPSETNIRQAIIEAVQLTKRYDDGVLALDHVSFESAFRPDLCNARCQRRREKQRRSISSSFY